MNRSLLALFERSLRLETRSPQMAWLRVGFLALILIMLYTTQMQAQSGWFGAPGLHFLQEIVWVNFLLITLSALGYFASAITEEKEEMMLGLLRMTNLNAVSILLGKSTSRLVGALLLLLVQVPFVLLAVALGGVSGIQIAAAYGTLLAYLFFICNLALLFSVIFRTTNTAAGLTLMALIFFLLAHYWAAALIHDSLPTWSTLATLTDYWRWATPFERLSAIFQTGFSGPVFGFQIWSNLLLGVLLFLVAWRVFDPCTRVEIEAAPARQWFFRRKSRRSRLPAKVRGLAAVSWKDFTFISGGRFGLAIKFGVVALVMAVINILTLEFGDHHTITLKFEGGVLIWISLIATALWLAVDAARIFSEEIKWKTWSSLATLPVSMSALAYRKVFGALTGTLPLLLGVVVGMILDPTDTADFINGIFKESEGFMVLMVVLLQYGLFLHLTAFLSLVIKRGALPLAFAIQYLGGSFLLGILGLAFAGARGPGGFFVVISFICLVATLILHLAIGRRLSRAIAEE